VGRAAHCPVQLGFDERPRNGFVLRLRSSLVSLSLTGGVRPVHVYIIRECSAIHVLGVILGLIVPLKAPWNRKAIGIILGSALIYAMNVSRVVLTGYDIPPLT